ncbi:MAG: TolC family protein [Verrucomicrobiota bacterium]
MYQFKILTNQSSIAFPNLKIVRHLSLVMAACFALVHFLGAVDLEAQETTGDITPESIDNLMLKNALALTLKGNPELIGFEYDIRSADALILQANLRPNPTLDTELEAFGGTGAFRGANSTESTLSLGQLIERGGKRNFRTNLARSQREVKRLEYEIKKRAVLVQTALRFIDVLEAQRRIIVNEEIVELTRQFEPVIKRRIEAGKGNPLELTKSKIAISSAMVELDQAKRALFSAREKLSAQWGVVEPRFSRVLGEFESIAPIAPLEELRNQLVTNPRLLSYKAEGERAKASLNLARATGKPDVTIWGGVRRYSISDDTAFVVGVSVPLPLFNRNQGGIRAASEQQQKVKAQRGAVVIQLSAELTAAYRKFTSSHAEIKVLRDEILPAAEIAQKQVKEGYQLGLFRYLEVLDTQRTLSTARLQLIQAFSNYRDALAQIEGLTGAASLKTHSSE